MKSTRQQTSSGFLASVGAWLTTNFACTKCSEMHRRAQAAESNAIATPRRFAGAIREATKRMCTYRELYWLVKGRNRALRDAMRGGGWSDEDIKRAQTGADAIFFERQRLLRQRKELRT